MKPGSLELQVYDIAARCIANTPQSTGINNIFPTHRSLSNIYPIFLPLFPCFNVDLIIVVGGIVGNVNTVTYVNFFLDKIHILKLIT